MASISKVLEFKVNGVLIPTPTTFKIEFQPISEGGRLLDATMVVKGIAPKLKITMSYPIITNAELAIIMGQTWNIFETTRNLTQTISFPTNTGETKSIETYFAPMSITLTPESFLNDSWENLDLVFIEL